MILNAENLDALNDAWALEYIQNNKHANKWTCRIMKYFNLSIEKCPKTSDCSLVLQITWTSWPLCHQCLTNITAWAEFRRLRRTGGKSERERERREKSMNFSKLLNRIVWMKYKLTIVDILPATHRFRGIFYNFEIHGKKQKIKCWVSKMWMSIERTKSEY